MKFLHFVFALPLCSALLMNQDTSRAQYGVPTPAKKTVTTWRELGADTWVATDKLGRKLPLGGQKTPFVVPAPRKDKFVGIFYFVWQGYHGTPGPFDISKRLQENPDDPKWGPQGSFHWWGEPEIGYFQAADPWVARRNLTLLGDAGVDTLFVDVTNAFTYPTEMQVLFETARTMRGEGNPTPQIAFIMNANTVPTMQRLWDEWYSKGLYSELWFRWPDDKGVMKPLILGNREEKTKEGASIPQQQQQFFTWRRSWFETDPKGWFGDGKDKWPWRDKTPQNYGWHDDPKKAEQLAVGIGSHPIGQNIGRSTQSGKEPPLDKFSLTPDYDKGLQFDEQWQRVWEVDPKLVFVTGWNEWVAQRFTVAPNQKINLAGKELKEGDTFFVDLYNAEFNRDADPMKGGSSDNYYYQLIANIRRFKGVSALPALSPPKTIDVMGSWAQWHDVMPEYRDNIGDTMHRNFAGWGNNFYSDNSGRNDIVMAKTTRDVKTFYFYARTREPLTPRADGNWMMLFLDTDQNASTGWHGYNFRLNSRPSLDSTSVEKWENNQWKEIARVPLHVGDNEIAISLPRILTGQTARAAFDFKWADNIDINGGIDEWFLQGDVAPPRRFNYRYQN